MVCRTRHSRYEACKPHRNRLTPAHALYSAKKHAGQNTKACNAWPTARISSQKPIHDWLWSISALAVTESPLKAGNQDTGALGRSHLSDAASVPNNLGVISDVYWMLASPRVVSKVLLRRLDACWCVFAGWAAGLCGFWLFASCVAC